MYTVSLYANLYINFPDFYAMKIKFSRVHRHVIVNNVEQSIEALDYMKIQMNVVAAIA